MGSTLVLAGLAVLFIFMLITQFQNWKKKQNVDSEIAQLTKQANSLQQKNQEISNSLTFLNSSDFKEKIAREQLNLKKDGEQVYNITDNPNSNTNSTNLEAANKPGDMSNARKWYIYFFQQ
jgi:cell division protein FtsB